MIIKNLNLKNFKKLLGVLQSLLLVVIFAILPLVVFTLISSKMEFLGFKSFVVLTGSMSPLIPTGSIVYSQNTNNYRIGDIISFEKNSVIVTHRIIDVLDQDKNHVSYFASPLGKTSNPSEVFYKTQGDANNVADSELVSAKSVVGEAALHFPYLGFLIMFLKTIQGFLLAVILPSFILIGFELWKIKGEIERNIESKMLQKMGRI